MGPRWEINERAWGEGTAIAASGINYVSLQFPPVRRAFFTLLRAFSCWARLENVLEMKEKSMRFLYDFVHFVFAVRCGIEFIFYCCFRPDFQSSPSLMFASHENVQSRLRLKIRSVSGKNVFKIILMSGRRGYLYEVFGHDKHVNVH